MYETWYTGNRSVFCDYLVFSPWLVIICIWCFLQIYDTWYTSSESVVCDYLVYSLSLVIIWCFLLQVCNTWSTGNGSVTSDYYMYETLFSYTIVKEGIVNTPPELDGPKNITFSEDEGNFFLIKCLVCD